MISTLIILAAAGLLTGAADPDRRGDIALDIYNRDQAYVRETRRVEVRKGLNSIEFHKVAPGIFGYSASVRPLEKQERLTTRLLSYNYDLVSHERLLDRYLGQWFSFATEDLVYEGRLLRYDEQSLFLQPDTTEPTLLVVDRGKLTEMTYPQMPRGLYLEPTLRWEVTAEKKMKTLPVELAYLTTDITWMCDYRAEILPGDSLALEGWFTLDNGSSLEFPSAKTTLVAGWTNRGSDPDEGPSGGDNFQAGEREGPRPSSPDQQRLDEYYRYTLPEPLDLWGEQTIQVPFFSAGPVAAERLFILPHLLEDEQVRVKMRFTNSGLAGEGVPLPEGDVGLYRRDADGTLRFVGEDFIAGVPAGGEVEMDVGTAFDITAKRTRLAQVRPERNRHEETWRVELTSGRDEPVTVRVQQRVYGYYRVSEATVEGEPVSWEAVDAGRIAFPVVVRPRSTTTLTFKLLYGY